MQKLINIPVADFPRCVPLGGRLFVQLGDGWSTLRLGVPGRIILPNRRERQRKASEKQGTIAAIGEGVTLCRAGQRVLFMVRENADRYFRSGDRLYVDLPEEYIRCVLEEPLPEVGTRIAIPTTREALEMFANTPDTPIIEPQRYVPPPPSQDPDDRALEESMAESADEFFRESEDVKDDWTGVLGEFRKMKDDPKAGYWKDRD